MTNLLDLPNEILTEILSFIAFEGYRFMKLSFLCSLSTLSRRFSLLLRPLLVENVCITFEDGPAKCILFLRSLKENPDLAHMVHCMKLYWTHADKDVHDSANELLKALPSLRALTVRAEWDRIPFRPRFLEVSTMTNLKTIVLFDPHLSIDNMQRYMVLDHVEHMTVWCRYFGAPSQSKDLMDRDSPLLTLDLDRNHHIPAEALLELLKRCPRIRKLACALPGQGVIEPLLSTTREMRTPLSPVELSKALASAQNSLQDLEFRVCPCKWPRPDSSRMDLKMMKVLRSISCPAQCFFVSGAHYSTRAGLYKLLPASLEKLTLYFEYGYGLLCWYDLIEGAGDYASKQYEEFLWLLELASNKAEYTPRLNMLHLEDSYGWGVPRVRWVPPRIIVDSLSEAKIHFWGEVGTRPPVQV